MASLDDTEGKPRELTPTEEKVLGVVCGGVLLIGISYLWYHGYIGGDEHRFLYKDIWEWMKRKYGG